jgi:hypothetical protein
MLALLLFALALASGSLVDEEGKAFTCNQTKDCLQIKDADGEPDERIVCHRGSCKPYGIRIMQSCKGVNDCDEKRCVCKDGGFIASMNILAGCDDENQCGPGETFEVLPQRLICNERKKCQIPCLDPFCGGESLDDKSHGYCNERGLCICEEIWEGNKCDRKSTGPDGEAFVEIVEGGVNPYFWLGSMFLWPLGAILGGIWLSSGD